MARRTVTLFAGDGTALMRQVRRDSDIRQPDVDLLVEAFLKTAGFEAGALCRCDEVTTLMEPFLRQVGSTVLRDAVRAAEKKAPLPGTPVTKTAVTKYKKASTAAAKSGTDVKVVDPVAARREALAAEFFNGSMWIAWGAATVADHEGQIAFYRGKIAGHEATVDKHLAAISLIRATPGATCLNDLETEFVP